MQTPLFVALLFVALRSGVTQGRGRRSILCCDEVRKKAYAPTEMLNDGCRWEINLDVFVSMGLAVGGWNKESKCKLNVKIRPVGVAAMLEDKSGQPSCSALQLHYDFRVSGPSPGCDGSYGQLYIRKGREYLSHIDFWRGRDDIHDPDSVRLQLRPGADPHRRQQSTDLLLPSAGNWTWELHYDYRAYVGMFDRGAAWRMQTANGLRILSLSPTKDNFEGNNVTFSANVPEFCLKSKHCEEALMKLKTPCQCTEDTSPMLPGYWHIDQDRWVPAYYQMPVFDAAATVDVLRCPSNVIVLGTSRQRTVFYDVVGLAGGDTSNAGKEQRSLSEPPVHYVYSHCGSDITPCTNCTDDEDQLDKDRSKFGTLDSNATKTINVTLKEFKDKAFCAKRLDGRKDFVFWTAGTCEVSHTKPPNGFTSGVRYAEAYLRALQQKCAEHHLVVVLELGLHDRWQSSTVCNSFKNNRMLAFNKNMIQIAKSLSIPVVDAYSPTQAYHFDDIWTHEARGVDRAHYYTRDKTQNPYTGNAASKLVAKMLLQYVKDHCALQSGLAACTAPPGTLKQRKRAVVGVV